MVKNYKYFCSLWNFNQIKKKYSWKFRKINEIMTFLPANFLKKAAELYNDIYKQNKFTRCSKNIENKKNLT